MTLQNARIVGRIARYVLPSTPKDTSWSGSQPLLSKRNRQIDRPSAREVPCSFDVQTAEVVHPPIGRSPRPREVEEGSSRNMQGVMAPEFIGRVDLIFRRHRKRRVQRTLPSPGAGEIQGRSGRRGDTLLPPRGCTLRLADAGPDDRTRIGRNVRRSEW